MTHENSNYTYVVLGAGLSGLTTAYELSKIPGSKVMVLEKERFIGGLARTINHNEYIYDLGSHRLHQKIKTKIKKYIVELIEKKPLRNIRGGKLKFRNRYIHYPIKTAQFITALGISELIKACFSLIKTKILNLHQSKVLSHTYASYLKNKVGQRIYKLFYEPYAIKVFGIDPNKLSLTAVKKRMSMVKPFTFLKEIIQNALFKKTPDYYYYFENGIGELAAALEKKILKNGAILVTHVTDWSLKAIPHKNKYEIKYTLDNKTVWTLTTEKIISTIPIDTLFSKLLPKSECSLSWRGLRLVFLHIDSHPLIAGETFYFPELKYPFGRVSIPYRFSPSLLPKKCTFISYLCEIPCTPGEPLWVLSEEKIYTLCYQKLVAAGIVHKNSKLAKNNFSIKLTHVYPVYTVDWQKSFDSIISDITNNFPNLYISGRSGLFLHNNMDHSLEIGQAVSQFILSGKNNRAWHSHALNYKNIKLRD